MELALKGSAYTYNANYNDSMGSDLQQVNGPPSTAHHMADSNENPSQ